MRFRTTVLLTLLGVSALIALYVTAYSRRTEERIEREVDGFAQVFANLLWNVEKANANAYARIIVDQGRFRSILVTHPEGTPFVYYQNDEVLSPIDRVLRRIGLIPVRTLSRPIRSEEDQYIGELHAEWINRNIHTYLSVAGPLTTVCLFLLALARFRAINEERLLNRLHLEEEQIRRLESQQRLEEAQAEFRELVESANDIIYKTNLFGRIEYANPVTERIMSYPNKVLTSRRYSDFIRNSYRSDVVHFYRRQLQDRVPNTYLEFPVITGDQREIWLGQNARLMLRDGRPVGFQAVARDITELKRAADEIAERDERMQEEMSLAKMIHQALLPIQLPRMDAFEFGVKFMPSGEIGGDFINMIRYPDPRRIGIMFADITGHGVAAALLAAMLKVLVDEEMGSGRPPRDCFRILNERLAREYPEGNFASAFFAILDAKDLSCTYVKGSQEPVILIRPGEDAVVLNEGGPALGLLNPDAFGHPEYTEKRIGLRPGDTLFFYTDGLVEIDPSGRVWVEQDELIEWLNAGALDSPQAMVDTIFSRSRAKAGNGHLADDVAILAVRVR